MGTITVSTPVPSTALLSFDETARYLGITPRTLRRWIINGRFPQALRIGAADRPRLRFRLADIQDFLDKVESRGVGAGVAAATPA